jgi:PTS system fructose-specific IIA component/PTS system nitrogen regulatory IIA component
MERSVETFQPLQSSGGRTQMDLLEFISDGNVKVPMNAADKTAAIVELVDFLVDKNLLDRALREGAVSALMERERSMSTGMEHGVALPHATVGFADKLISAMGIHKTGVQFDAPDNSKARIIILMLVPQNKFTEHVRTLAGISRVLSDEKFRSHLKKASSPREAVAIIRMHTSGPGK